MKSKNKEKKIEKEKSFTKFEIVERILSEEERLKEEASEISKSTEFSKSEKFKGINKCMEKLIIEMDALPIELRARMFELTLSYLSFGVKLPNYLKDGILQKVVDDKLRKLDMDQLSGILGQIGNMSALKKGTKENGKEKEYIG